MTTRVKVTNEDAGATIIVAQEDIGSDGSVIFAAPRTPIQPGKSEIFYVHHKRRLTIEEKEE